jgi:hypothetical protein
VRMPIAGERQASDQAIEVSPGRHRQRAGRQIPTMASLSRAYSEMGWTKRRFSIETPIQTANNLELMLGLQVWSSRVTMNPLTSKVATSLACSPAPAWVSTMNMSRLLNVRLEVLVRSKSGGRLLEGVEWSQMPTPKHGRIANGQLVSA